MAAAARGNEPDEKNIMDGGDDWGQNPWVKQREDTQTDQTNTRYVIWYSFVDARKLGLLQK